MERGRTVTPLARAPSPLTPPPSPSRSSCRLFLSLLHFCEPFRRMHGLALGGTHTHTHTWCPFHCTHSSLHGDSPTCACDPRWHGRVVSRSLHSGLDSISVATHSSTHQGRAPHRAVSSGEREWVKGWDYTNASKACTDCVMWGGVVVERVVVMARGCGSRLSAGNSRSSMHHGRCDHTWARSDVGLVRCGPRCVSVCEWT
jgi:hypothetical protein